MAIRVQTIDRPSNLSPGPHPCHTQGQLALSPSLRDLPPLKPRDKQGVSPGHLTLPRLPQHGHPRWAWAGSNPTHSRKALLHQTVTLRGHLVAAGVATPALPTLGLPSYRPVLDGAHVGGQSVPQPRPCGPETGTSVALLPSSGQQKEGSSPPGTGLGDGVRHGGPAMVRIGACAGGRAHAEEYVPVCLPLPLPFSNYIPSTQPVDKGTKGR